MAQIGLGLCTLDTPILAHPSIQILPRKCREIYIEYGFWLISDHSSTKMKQPLA